jgi:hypothetical protein
LAYGYTSSYSLANTNTDIYCHTHSYRTYSYTDYKSYGNTDSSYVYGNGYSVPNTSAFTYA